MRVEARPNIFQGPNEPPLTRAERRIGEKLNSRAVHITDEINKVALPTSMRTREEYSTVYYELKVSLGRRPEFLDLAYGADPRIFVDYLDAERIISKLSQERKRFGNNFTPEDKAKLAKFQSERVYDRPVQGLSGILKNDKPLSLRDIEQLELPFSPENIERMLHFFIDLSLVRDSRLQGVRTFLTLFLLQSQIFGTEHIPPGLQPLYRRMVTFFDFLTDFVLNFPASEESEGALRKLTESTVLSPLLAMYLLTRQGLSPSSIIKLLLERKRQISPKKGILERFLTGQVPFLVLIIATRQITEKVGYDPRLLYDEAREKAIEQLLISHYRLNTSSEDAQREAVIKTEELLKRLSGYRIKATSMSRKNKTSEPDSINWPTNSITLVEFTFKRNGLLSLILQFGEREKSLVIEIDKANRVFGLPPEIAIDYPNAEAYLLADVLPSILARLREKYPDVEPEKVSPTVRPQRIPPLLVTQVVVPHERGGVRKEKPPPKRTLSPFQAFLEDQQAVRLVEPAQKKFKVIHTRKMVEGLLRNAPASDIDRIMKAIKSFEWGAPSVEKLSSQENRWSLHVGRYRVILERVGDNVFRIVDVGRRDTIYRGLKPRADE